MSCFPCVDGDVVTGVPADVIASGSAVPLLTGTTTEEFRLFTVPTGVAASITAEALPLVLARYGWPSETAQVYARNRPDATPGDLVTAMLTDTAFRVPTVRLAEATVAGGAPAHVYEFAWQTDRADLGACHALELPFVFDTLYREPEASLIEPGAAPQSLATEMHSAWVSFARVGDPGWPAYTPDDRAVMRFDTESSLVRDPRADELGLWMGRPVAPA
jgi:para-nitrobenzyl esterase